MEYEFDVALSFHSNDEHFAKQTYELISDRYRTFIYTAQQAALAGRNGEDAFGEVFLKKAALVVVFYRPEWGETPFTRFEQTAIRNRGFDDGYGFTIFAVTQDGVRTPNWVPKAQLYLSLPSYGVKGLAAVIESKLQELGAMPSIETTEARAARIARQQDFREARHAFRLGPNLRAAAGREVLRIRECLEGLVQALSADNERVARLRIDTSQLQQHILFGNGLPCCVFYWKHSNSSDGMNGAELVVDVYNGPPNLSGFHWSNEGRIIRSIHYKFDLFFPDVRSFARWDDVKVPVSAEQIAQDILFAQLEA